MSLFAPFFGVSGFGRVFARWLNRLLILAEIAFAVWSFRYHLSEVWLPFETHWKILYFPGCLVAANILNRILRGIWNIFIILFYGTSNPAEIASILDARDEKKAYKAQAAAEYANLRKEKRLDRREDRRRKQLEFNKKQMDYLLYAPSYQIERRSGFFWRILRRCFRVI